MGEAENLDAQVPDELRPGINRDPIPVERGCLGLRLFIAAPEDLYLAPGTSRAAGFEFTIRDTHIGDFTTGAQLSARCGLGFLEVEQKEGISEIKPTSPRSPRSRRSGSVVHPQQRHRR